MIPTRPSPSLLDDIRAECPIGSSIAVTVREDAASGFSKNIITYVGGISEESGDKVSGVIVEDHSSDAHDRLLIAQQPKGNNKKMSTGRIAIYETAILSYE